jgi:hypothetical protein
LYEPVTQTTVINRVEARVSVPHTDLSKSSSEDRSTSMGSLVGGVSLKLLPLSDDLVKVALRTAGGSVPRVVRFLVEGVSKIESRPLGLEDAFTAELEPATLVAAGLESHPRRLFCFFCSWGFDFAEGKGIWGRIPG